jgi:hypothetical protein
MKQYPLIGVSICAVVLLVLGSLTNVVGYQSVKSTTVNDSPLFATRTQRATNQQQNILTSQYLGMGKGNLLQFPLRDNKTELLKRAIDIISKMDDTTFARFTELLIQKARQNDTLQDLSHYQIVQSLLLLKTNPDAIINSYTIRNNQELPKTVFTYCGTPTWCAWGPGCLLFLIFWIPIILLDVIGEVIYTILTIVLTTANY